MNLLRKTVLAALFACAFPAAAFAGKQPVDAAPAPSPALWRVSDDDSSIYLFASIGLSPKGAVWRSRSVARAIDVSEVLWLEAEVDSPAAQSAANRIFNEEGVLPKGERLSSLLPPAAAAKFEATIENAGLAASSIEPLEPWSAFVLLSSRIDPDPDSETIDAALVREGRSRGRQIRYFETVEDALHRLTDMPRSTQIETLAQLLSDFENQRDETRAEFEAWRTGDLTATDAFLNQPLREASPDAYKALVADRIETLATGIRDILKAPDPAFVSLNASYFTGNGSLTEALAAEGLRVERVND